MKLFTQEIGFGGTFLKLDRWKEQDRCVNTRLSGDALLVNMVRLPLHLWNVDLFKKIGKLCGVLLLLFVVCMICLE